MTFACDIPFLQKEVFDSKQFAELNDAQKADMDARMQRFVQDLNTFAPVSNDAGQAAVRAGILDEFQSRQRFMLETARHVHVNPTAGKNLQYFLAYDFGIEKSLAGFGDELSVPGGMRHIINRSKRMGAGESHVILANIEFLERSRKADTAINELARKYGVDHDLMARIKLDMYELGLQPIVTTALKADSPPAVKFQAMRQERLAKLMQQAGIDQAGVKKIGDIVSNVVNSYNEVYEITKAFGVNVGDSSDYLNYFPRDLSPEAKRRIAWSRDSQVDYTTYNFDGTSQSENIYSAFTKARVTNHYIPQDAILVDWILTKADPEIYSKLGVEGILDVIQDDHTFTTAFVKYIDKAQPRLFTGMVESSLIARLPMTAGETFSYMASRYKLPFNQLSEFMATDFETGARLYRNQLEQLAGRAVATRYVATAALEGGWGITAAEKAADSRYANYVPLIGSDKTAAIPSSFVDRFQLDPELYGTTYVHPMTANFYRAAIDLQKDPVMMGGLARLFEDYKGSFMGQALATSGFIFRQTFGVAVAVHAAGGNVVGYAVDTARMLTQLATLWGRGKTLDGFPDMFDNKIRNIRYRGRLITERELWNTMRTEGFVQDIMPFAGQKMNTTGYKPRAGDLEAVRRQARYMASIFANGDLSAPQKFANLYGTASTGANNLSEKMFYSFQMMNTLLDQVARFTTVKSLATNSALDRGMRLAQGNISRTMDVDQAITHARNYFFDYDSIGRTGDALRHHFPFLSFMGQNTFGIMRMMVRDPTRFVAYNRLYAAMNEPADQEGSDLPEAGVDGWLQRTNPVYWIEKATGRVIAFPTTGWDPVQSGQSAIFGAADDLANLLGYQNPKTTDETLDNLPWQKNKTNRTLTALMDAMYPHMEVMYGLITNEDLKGYSLEGETSFLGVPMSAMNRFVLSSFHPALNNLNRSNPGMIFGRPAEFDQEGNLVRAPVPAWLTGASRDNRDRAADFRNSQQRILAALGVTSYVVDVAYGMGKNEEQVRYELRAGRQAINAKERQIRQLTNPRDIERGLQELEQLRFVHATLVLDWENFQAWRAERGLSHPAAVAQQRRLGLRSEQIRVLTEQQEYDILKEIYGEAIPND